MSSHLISPESNVICMHQFMDILKSANYYQRMFDFKIRSAKSGDESGIHEAHMRSIREICVKDHGESEIKDWGNRPLDNRWIEPIKIEHVWIVENNDKIYRHSQLMNFIKT